MELQTFEELIDIEVEKLELEEVSVQNMEKILGGLSGDIQTRSPGSMAYPPQQPITQSPEQI